MNVADLKSEYGSFTYSDTEANKIDTFFKLVFTIENDSNIPTLNG